MPAQAPRGSARGGISAHGRARLFHACASYISSVAPTRIQSLSLSKTAAEPEIHKPWFRAVGCLCGNHQFMSPERACRSTRHTSEIIVSRFMGAILDAHVVIRQEMRLGRLLIRLWKGCVDEVCKRSTYTLRISKKKKQHLRQTTTTAVTPRIAKKSL